MAKAGGGERRKGANERGAELAKTRPPTSRAHPAARRRGASLATSFSAARTAYGGVLRRN
jgi:hypothetical protein